MRPRPTLRVGAPITWIGTTLLVTVRLFAVGPPGLWLVGVVLSPAVVWLAACYRMTELVVDGDRVQLVTPLHTRQFDRDSIERVTPGSLVLVPFRCPPPMIHVRGGTRALARTRRNAEGRSTLVAAFVMPGLSAERVREAVGLPAPDPGPPSRPLFLEGRRLRPLAWIYLGGIALIAVFVIWGTSSGTGPFAGNP